MTHSQSYVSPLIYINNLHDSKKLVQLFSQSTCFQLNFYEILIKRLIIAAMDIYNCCYLLTKKLESLKPKKQKNWKAKNLKSKKAEKDTILSFRLKTVKLEIWCCTLIFNSNTHVKLVMQLFLKFGFMTSNKKKKLKKL